LVEMDCTVVVLPSAPVLGVVVGRAKVEAATGGEMSRVSTGRVGTERTSKIRRVISLTSPVIPVSEYSIVDLISGL
jgi:hypothetical protein